MLDDLFRTNKSAYNQQVNRFEKLVFETSRILYNLSYDTDSQAGSLITKARLRPLYLESLLSDATDRERLEQLHERLKQLLTACLGIVESLDVFQKIQFSGPTYNIITQDSKRERVLRVTPITISQVQFMTNLLRLTSQVIFRFLEMPATAFNWQKIDEIMVELGDSAGIFLETHGLLPSDAIFKPHTNKTIFENLNQTSLAVLVLSLALGSFVKSHVGDFDRTQFKAELQEILIETPDHAIYLARQPLACLDEFANGPVWTFSTTSVKNQSSPFYLSISLSEFSNLWGPLCPLWIESGDDIVLQIDTRAGSIHEVSPFSTVSKCVSVQPNETLCHWYSLKALPEEIIHTTAFSLRNIDLVLIGAPLSLPKVAVLLLPQNNQLCSCDQVYAHRFPSLCLGTRQSHYRSCSVEANVGYSKPFNFGITKTWKKNPAWTLEDQILQEWAEWPERANIDDPRSIFIDYDTVIEISMCTGHAQRTSIWHILGSPEIQEYLKLALEDKVWRTLNLPTQATKYSNFHDLWHSVQGEVRDAWKRAIKLLVRTMGSTGYTKNLGSSLQVWDVSLSNVATLHGDICRRISPSWGSLVKDSQDIASFAVMRGFCLKFQYSVHNRFYEPVREPPYTDAPFADTLLYTKMRISLKSLNDTSLAGILALENDKVQAASCSKDTAGFEDSLETALQDFLPFQEAPQQLESLSSDDENHGKRRTPHEPKHEAPFGSYQSQTELHSNALLERQMHHARLRMERLVHENSSSPHRKRVTSYTLRTAEQLDQLDLREERMETGAAAYSDTEKTKRTRPNSQLLELHFHKTLNKFGPIPPYKVDTSLVMIGSVFPVLESYHRELGLLHIQPKMAQSVIDLDRAYRTKSPGAFHTQWKPHSSAREKLNPLLAKLDWVAQNCELTSARAFRRSDKYKWGAQCAEHIYTLPSAPGDRILRVCVE